MTPRSDHDDLHGRPAAKPGQVLVVIAGGRDLHPTPDDAWWVRAWLLHLGATTVVHGAGPHLCDDVRCRRDSLDVWAGRVATRLGLGVLAYPMERRDPSSGPRRNLVMLDLGPAALLALPGSRGCDHRPGSGTGHVVHHARARGIPVYLRGQDDPPST
jgi:hypothetical protein